jgi:hypothetical protein
MMLQIVVQFSIFLYKVYKCYRSSANEVKKANMKRNSKSGAQAKQRGEEQGLNQDDNDEEESDT